MNSKIYNRILYEEKYMIDTNCTIREIAKITKVSKSTVHNDLHYLEKINKEMYKKIEKILKYHSQIKNIRGGYSTKLKYKRR